MEERLVLEKTDYDNNKITVYGKTYPLTNTCFTTVDPQNPGKLLPEEEDVINKLLLSFQQSEKLKRHMSFLMQKVHYIFLITVIYSSMAVFLLMKMEKWKLLKLKV